MKVALLDKRPVRSYAEIERYGEADEMYGSLERAPVGSRDVYGTTNTGSAFGSDAKTSQNLIGMTANEQPEMLPPYRFWIFDQMRKEDAAVKSALWLFKMPMRSAEYPVQPAAETPEDRICADAFCWQFGFNGKPGVMDLSWREQLGQACLKLDFGCMFEETIIGDVDIFYDADGDPHPMRPITRLMPLFPQTIRMPDGIETNQLTGKIAWLAQDLPKTRPVPGEKLNWHVLDREGSDWLGTSLLRPMYGSWRLKKAVMISAGIGWDRFAFGTPVIRYPKGGGSTRKREAEDIGRNWNAAERGYFVLEGTAAEGWDVDVKGTGDFSDPTNLIHTYDEQISAAALQHMMSLGKSTGGNRALGDAQGEPYYMALGTLLDDIMSDKARQVHRKWVDMNFGPEYDLPKINPSKLTARNVAVLAAAIAALSDAGLSFTDAGTVSDIREWLDLRQLPEAAQQAAEAALDEFPDEVGLEPTVSGGPAALPARRIPQAGATDSAGRPAMSEGEGLGL